MLRSRESEILEISESGVGNFGKVGYLTSDSASLVVIKNVELQYHMKFVILQSAEANSPHFTFTNVIFMIMHAAGVSNIMSFYTTLKLSQRSPFQ